MTSYGEYADTAALVSASNEPLRLTDCYAQFITNCAAYGLLKRPVWVSVERPGLCRLGYDDNLSVEIDINSAELADNDIERACRRAMPGVEFDYIWRGERCCVPAGGMRSVTWLVDVSSDHFGATVLFKDKASIKQTLQHQFGVADFDICAYKPHILMEPNDDWVRYFCVPKRPHREVYFFTSVDESDKFTIWLDDQDTMATLKTKIRKLKGFCVNKISSLWSCNVYTDISQLKTHAKYYLE